MTRYRVLEGLPPYGPAATPFPTDWGRRGGEGLVIEFNPTSSERWTANFASGLGGLNEVILHPDQQHVIVFAGGDAWSVNPERRNAAVFASAINARWEVPDGLVLSRQGLAFLRIGISGIVWHTRRLSWDGFSEVVVGPRQLTALAWSPLEDRWMPCSVDLRSGASEGGSFGDNDVEGWQKLAQPG